MCGRDDADTGSRPLAASDGPAILSRRGGTGVVLKGGGLQQARGATPANVNVTATQSGASPFVPLWKPAWLPTTAAGTTAATAVATATETDAPRSKVRPSTAVHRLPRAAHDVRDRILPPPSPETAVVPSVDKARAWTMRRREREEQTLRAVLVIRASPRNLEYDSVS